MNSILNSVEHYGVNIVIKGWLEGFQKGDEVRMTFKQNGNKIVVIQCLLGGFHTDHPGVPKEMIIKPGSDADKTCEELWYEAADALNAPPVIDDDSWF